MQYTLLTAALGLASFSSASAISNTARSSSLLRLPVNAVPKSSLLGKRQNDVSIINSDQGTSYLIDIHVGTPPQPITLSIDTGSSSTWVNPDCANSGGVQFCESFPRFNWQASTSLVNEGLPMNLTYGVGEANGTFVTDILTVGNAKITKQEIGICGWSEFLPTGLMGLSPYAGVSTSGTGNPTLIDNLASEGFTNSRAFSLDLRDVDSPDGSLIFGGIDTGKYEGSLQKLPIIPAAQAPDQTPRYWVHMNTVGITKPGQASKKYPSSSNDPQGQPVFLDSGSTISILPSALVDAIVADFPGAKYDSTQDLYEVDCSFASQAGTMDFSFGAKEIKVPFHQFIWQQQGQPCYLGAHKNDEFVLLGDTFLRAAYAVFDLDNKNLHIAQAANCGTNLVEIGKGPNAVPSLVGDCGKPHTTTTSKTKTTSKTTTTSSSATTTTSPATTTTPASTYPATTYPASSPSYPVGNSTASGTVSTIYSTTVYTISSCAPTITNCPYGQTTTEIIGRYTTYCPETPTGTGSYPVVTPTGSVYPVQPTYTPQPTFTGSAGKAAANMVVAVMAAIAAVAML